MPSFVIREREPDDVTPLGLILGEQQPTSRYPLRWPLPFPVEEFVVRPGQVAAWVAEEDGVLLGHVAAATVGDDDTGAAYRAATGRADLLEVAVLFTSVAARGRGVGGALLDTAAGFIRERGSLPVLDVLHDGGSAADVYRHRGWVEVGRLTPSWMPPDHPSGVREVLLMVLPD